LLDRIDRVPLNDASSRRIVVPPPLPLRALCIADCLCALRSERQRLWNVKGLAVPRQRDTWIDLVGETPDAPAKGGCHSSLPADVSEKSAPASIRLQDVVALTGNGGPFCSSRRIGQNQCGDAGEKPRHLH